MVMREHVQDGQGQRVRTQRKQQRPSNGKEASAQCVQCPSFLFTLLCLSRVYVYAFIRRKNMIHMLVLLLLSLSPSPKPPLPTTHNYCFRCAYPSRNAAFPCPIGTKSAWHVTIRSKSHASARWYNGRPVRRLAPRRKKGGVTKRL